MVISLCFISGASVWVSRTPDMGVAPPREAEVGEVVVLATDIIEKTARDGMVADDWLGDMPDPALGLAESHAVEYHLPVMAGEVVSGLVVEENGVILDGTLGEGGHSGVILRASPQARLVIGVDLDQRSVAVASQRLSPFSSRFLPLQGNYADMVALVAERGVRQVDGVLLDLGFSSRQVDRPGYGLSFQADEPLDMRYDAGQPLDASAIVNSYSEPELAGLLRRYGEEPRARAIARAVVRERASRPITSTVALASLVERLTGRRGGRRVHPATRVFQALRIAVNGELDNLQAGLEAAVGLLRPGGHLAVISYHSLEDRIVKNFLARQSAACVCPPGLPVCVCGHSPTMEIINRRVMRPSVEEVASNPRSRSARLRLARRMQPRQEITRPTI